MLRLFSHLDSLVLKGVDGIISVIRNMVIKPLSVTIGGIPINLIMVIIFVLMVAAHLYSHDVKHDGKFARKISEKMENGKFTKWLVTGAFGLIGLIFAL